MRNMELNKPWIDIYERIKNHATAKMMAAKLLFGMKFFKCYLMRKIVLFQL